MSVLRTAVADVVKAQKKSNKPLAIVLAGHNGSGKSTLWYEHLVPELKIPLINADRMMLSILPEVPAGASLPVWAQKLRDTQESWQRVAQDGVQAFVVQAMGRKVPFAMETVFSHWVERTGKTPESKIDRIRDMQNAGYFVLLIFVGLANKDLSIMRVQTRVRSGGHSVPRKKLVERFPRTQHAISHALGVVDAAILVDNSRDLSYAFTVCHVQQNGRVTYDCRGTSPQPPATTMEWLNIVVPLQNPTLQKAKTGKAKRQKSGSARSSA